MPIVADDEEFTFTCTGEKTKQKYTGKFRAKKSLSMFDHIASDRRFRDLLGGTNPSHAGNLAANLAGLSAELSVRITKGPSWWVDSENGLTLRDANVLAELYDAAEAIEKKALADEMKEAEADKEALRTTIKDDE